MTRTARLVLAWAALVLVVAGIWFGLTPKAIHILLVQDLHIRVVNAATGELLRELILDPNRDYQPAGTAKGPTRSTPK